MRSIAIQITITLGALLFFCSEPAIAVCHCYLRPPDRAWLSEALDVRANVHRDLGHDPTPPRLIAFDTRCTWYLNVASPSASCKTQIDEVLLIGEVTPEAISFPGGVRVTPLRSVVGRGPQVIAKTVSYEWEGAHESVVLVALPSLSNEGAGFRKDLPFRREHLLGLAAHEFVHEVQLPMFAPQIREAVASRGISAAFSDDYIERRFRGNRVFRQRMLREISLLWKAVHARDRAEKANLIEEALEIARERRAAYAGDETLIAIESLFVWLEGRGEWARWRTIAERIGGSADALIRQVRGHQMPWSQDAGLAIVMLVEQYGIDQPSFLDDPLLVLARTAGGDPAAAGGS